jgi:hypothetical protein
MTSPLPIKSRDQESSVIYTSRSFIFMALCLVKHRDFTFTLFFAFDFESREDADWFLFDESFDVLRKVGPGI